MRRKHGPVSDGPSEEAAFELGVVFAAIKDELVAFAAKEGSPYSFADVAARVSRLLQAEALREQLRDSEHLSQMRQNGAGHHRGRPPQSGRYELAAETAVFQGSPSGRTLSKKARKAISKAQRERWAKFHAKQGQSGPGRGHRTSAQLKRMRKGIKSYWMKMTPEERSAEMLRRQELSKKRRGAA